jgi:hypothetical protein
LPADRRSAVRPTYVLVEPRPRGAPDRRGPTVPLPRERRDYGPSSPIVAAIVARTRNLTEGQIAALDALDPPTIELDRRFGELDRRASRWPASRWVGLASRDAASAVWEAMARRGLSRPDRTGRARWRSGVGRGYGAARQAALTASALAIRERLEPAEFALLTAAWGRIVGLPPDLPPLAKTVDA